MLPRSRAWGSLGLGTLNAWVFLVAARSFGGMGHWTGRSPRLARRDQERIVVRGGVGGASVALAVLVCAAIVVRKLDSLGPSLLDVALGGFVVGVLFAAADLVLLRLMSRARGG